MPVGGNDDDDSNNFFMLAQAQATRHKATIASESVQVQNSKWHPKSRYGNKLPDGFLDRPRWVDFLKAKSRKAGGGCVICPRTSC